MPLTDPEIKIQRIKETIVNRERGGGIKKSGSVKTKNTIQETGGERQDNENLSRDRKILGKQSVLRKRKKRTQNQNEWRSSKNI